MGVKIPIDVLANDVADLIGDCVKHRMGPKTMIQVNNGANTAQMDHMMFTSLPSLYWNVKTMRLRQSNNDSPIFVQGYNERAAALGLPAYYVTIDDIIVLLVITMLYVHAEAVA